MPIYVDHPPPSPQASQSSSPSQSPAYNSHIPVSLHKSRIGQLNDAEIWSSPAFCRVPVDNIMPAIRATVTSETTIAYTLRNIYVTYQSALLQLWRLRPKLSMRCSPQQESYQTLPTSSSSGCSLPQPTTKHLSFCC